MATLSDELRKELRSEYWKLSDTVGSFDQRLLTVKGWGVTLGLAALAWGFEKQHYGLFLVSSLSALGFWAIEAVYKRHQMRMYVRMRDIEIALWQYAREGDDGGLQVSSPLADWTWRQADTLYRSGVFDRNSPPEPYGRRASYDRTWGFAGVAFPHVLAFLAGLLLFALGFAGKLGQQMTL